MWHWVDGALVTSFEQHSRSVNSIALTGKLICSVSTDRTVKAWRWATGEVLATFTADLPLYSLALEPEHGILLAGDRDGHVHVLRVVGLDHLLFPEE